VECRMVRSNEPTEVADRFVRLLPYAS